MNNAGGMQNAVAGSAIICHGIAQLKLVNKTDDLTIKNKIYYYSYM